MNQLESSFHAFIGSLPDVEQIDAIEMPRGFESSKRADYFLSQRQIIVELKSLEVDPSEKIEIALRSQRDRSDFPVFYGEADLRKVLSRLPDGSSLHKKVAQRVTRSIEEAFRSARHQIAETGNAFGLHGADGLLVILNHDIDIFAPQILAQKCRELIDGPSAETWRLPSINSVWIVQSTHYAGMKAGNKLVPSIHVESAKRPLSAAARVRIVALAEERARFDGVPFIGFWQTDGIKTASSFARERVVTPMPWPHTDLWRKQYRENPYLRDMSNEAFLVHASRIVDQLAPFFALHDGQSSARRSVSTESDLAQAYMSAWTHCLMEMNERMIDVRDLMAAAKGLA